jgi:hypothetical protein
MRKLNLSRSSLVSHARVTSALPLTAANMTRRWQARGFVRSLRRVRLILRVVRPRLNRSARGHPLRDRNEVCFDGRAPGRTVTDLLDSLRGSMGSEAQAGQAMSRETSAAGRWRWAWAACIALCGACSTQHALFGSGEAAIGSPPAPAQPPPTAGIAGSEAAPQPPRSGPAAEGGSAGRRPFLPRPEPDAGQGSPPPAESEPETFVNLAPDLGAPLAEASPLDPPPPAGWAWYEIPGASCRDGSPAGFYVRLGDAKALAIFLEGGGACSNAHFCNYNPPNVRSALAGDGATVLGGLIGTLPGRQQPGVYADASHVGAPAGIHDFGNPDNPFKDWSHVYIPYCTGDMHFGSQPYGRVPDLDGEQRFVGYLNMRLFIARIVPTFKSSVERVILTGSSAGGFGALLNYSMVQDAFRETPVDVIDDSGMPFRDEFLPVCLQKRWRELWGFDSSFPSDCTECRQEDGGNLIGVLDFLWRKHPNARLALLSGTEDEMIRMLYSAGLSDCSNYDSADPIYIAAAGSVLDPKLLYSAEDFSAGIDDLRASLVEAGRVAMYLVGAPKANVHQHICRPSFYSDESENKTAAQFLSAFLAGMTEQVGP